MLRLLLDEHLSQEIAEQVRAHNPEIPIVSIHVWREGDYCGKPDDLILEAAHEEHLTLVTYDQRTILPIVQWWGTEGRSHSGLIMVSMKTTRSNNFGALVRNILTLWERRGQDDWTDELHYLTGD
jgi:hypothetical protein